MMSRFSFVLAAAVAAAAISLPSVARAEGSSAATDASSASGTPTSPPPVAPAPATDAATTTTPGAATAAAPATGAPATAAAAPAANANDRPTTEATKRDDKVEDHSVYLSFSPFHLLFPIVEGTAEVKLHRKIGVAGIFGAGSMKAGGYKFKVWEVGGQFVGYPVGHFDNGMQLGVEAMYASVTTSDSIDQNTTLSGVGSGFSIGPMIGYKLATKVGFSFNIQGGAAAVVARAEVSSGSATAKAEQSTIVPILNINVGWSF